MVAKEASRRGLKNQLWTVRPDGDWSVLATEGKLSVRGRDATPTAFEKTCFVENAITDTQAAVWRCARDKTIVVSFRGTEMHRPRDLITDVNFAPASFSPSASPEGSPRRNQVPRRVPRRVPRTRGYTAGSSQPTTASAGASSRRWTTSSPPDPRATRRVRARARSTSANALARGVVRPRRLARLRHRTQPRRRARHPLLRGARRVRRRGRARVHRHHVQLRLASRRQQSLRPEMYNAPSRTPFASSTDRTSFPTLPALLGYRHVDHGVRIPSGKGGALCGARDVRTRIERRIRIRSDAGRALRGGENFAARRSTGRGRGARRRRGDGGGRGGRARQSRQLGRVGGSFRG